MSSLRVGSTHYHSVTGIAREDGGSLSGTAGTAFIFLATDTTATPLTNSIITLTVSGTTAHGTFPATVSLTAGLGYVIRTTITQTDGSTTTKDDEITASRA